MHVLFDDYSKAYLTSIFPIIQLEKQNANTLTVICRLFDTLYQSFSTFLMLLGYFFRIFGDYIDAYLIIIVFIWAIWSISVKTCKVSYAPNFAFARLCCLKMPVVRQARPAKVISDLLDSSLQSVLSTFRCWLWEIHWESYKCEDANSPSWLQGLHLKFKNCSVCLLCVWLVWRCTGNLRKCNVSV